MELRGRLGPLARSKRLRMVRTALLAAATSSVFERQENDGRHHSPLAAAGRGGRRRGRGSALAMQLHYGGALWGPVLERLLADEVERSRARLLALVSSA